MKLVKAGFQNFRLLRNVEVRFATDPKRPLTVVRAANESGKTTLLHGLQWVLYGDTALPGKGHGFRLFPVDWDSAKDGRQVEVQGFVEFEIAHRRKRSDGITTNRRTYRLDRKVVEVVSQEATRRLSSTVKLFSKEQTGWKDVPEPETWINGEVSSDLREVFFTDGDRALGFISADLTPRARRVKVEKAIRSLLGLDIVDSALRHIKEVRRTLQKGARKVADTSNLSDVLERLMELERQLDGMVEQRQEAEDGFRDYSERVAVLNREVDDVLSQGNMDDLQSNLANVRAEIKGLMEDDRRAAAEHAAVFATVGVAEELLTPALAAATEILEQMKKEGRIPKATIPVLRDCLRAEKCICGESLRVGDKLAEVRRSCIEKLIEDRRQADDMGGIVTELYYGRNTDVRRNWVGQYEQLVQRRDAIDGRLEVARRRRRALENKIDALPDKDLAGIRRTLRQYTEQRDRYLARKSELDAEIRVRQDEKLEMENGRDELLRRRKAHRQTWAQLHVARDVDGILGRARSRITSDELDKVSLEMNRMFLEMIGADTEQSNLIQRTKVTESFDIIVVGPRNRHLDPDKDLNGASRRALTLAFILALVRVSAYEAPNVIDTPLGMTSGYVKQAILRTAVSESFQLILLLTHDEISGCEDALDDVAGRVVTFTNTAHYPRILLHDPGTEVAKVLCCECDHRAECTICSRRISSDTDAGGEGE